MRRNRKLRRVAGVTAAAMISAGVMGGLAAPAGVAQTNGCSDANGPIYCEPSTPVPPGGPTNAQLRAKCIAKAQTKFGDNRPKMKKAIKKCKQKYKG
jgi:hypothetical protein